MTIAGSDPSGGAGLQADLKTFHQFGVYGTAVVTLITVQNTLAVTRVEVLGAGLVEQQARAVLDDLKPVAVKTGALGSVANVCMAARLQREYGFPLVVDPVMVSTHGHALLADEATRALLTELLPRATLMTPNLAEAAVLTGRELHSIAAMREAARMLYGQSGAATLVKGGHLPGDACDVLCHAGGIAEFHAARIDTRHTHGTGCTYSAAITAQLGRGLDLVEAVRTAKAYVTAAIRANPDLGAGHGPLNHFAPIAPV